MLLFKYKRKSHFSQLEFPQHFENEANGRALRIKKFSCLVAHKKVKCTNVVEGPNESLRHADEGIYPLLWANWAYTPLQTIILNLNVTLDRNQLHSHHQQWPKFYPIQIHLSR